MMRTFAFLGLCLLQASLVLSHGGLTYPPAWWDAEKTGFGGKVFGYLGCTQDVSPADRENGLKSKCYYNFFSNGVNWPKFPEEIQRLEKRIQQDGARKVRMPRKMFVNQSIVDLYPAGSEEYNNLKFNSNRATKCLGYDLTTAKGLELFNSRCKNPWMQPGLTKVASPCGVAGGNPVELNGQPFPYCGGNCGPKCKTPECCQDPGNGTNICAAGWADGKGAEKYHYPNSPVTEWKRGKRAMVGWNIHANHMGGYAWRLCKIPNEGISGVTEECFQNGHLSFNGARWLRTENEFYSHPKGGWTKEKRPLSSRQGTWPKGSQWRKNPYFDAINEMNGASKYRGQIKEFVKVPKNLPAGEYALSLRWDCEGAGQIWQGCSTVKLV